MTPRSRDPYEKTLAVYEDRARDWFEKRSADTDHIGKFAEALSAPGLPEGAVVDLGCGPGWHLDFLPEGTIALDGAAAMLEVTAEVSPTSPLVQADLRNLPFASKSLKGVWANKSYVHVARTDTPLALRELHRCIAVGGIAHLGVFGGDEEHSGYSKDDFAGRSFSLWPTELILDVVQGAGFSVTSFKPADPYTANPLIAVSVRRERALPDSVGAGMRLLLVGLNPSLHAADSGVGFSGPSNRGWPALVAAGLAPPGVRVPEQLLSERGIGMTDIVKRATRSAAELNRADYEYGIARLHRLCEWLQPAAVCVIGLAGWRAAVDRQATEGVQTELLGGRPVYLMPNPSGLNAHATVGDLAAHFRSAYELGGAG
jgi:TDG/mug DNA glycosylase family protein